MAQQPKRYPLAFVLAGCAPALIRGFATGVRSFADLLEVIIYAVPLVLVPWAAICMTAYASAYSVAYLMRDRRPQEARSWVLSVVVGVAIGLVVMCAFGCTLWGLATVAALGPVLFRTCPEGHCDASATLRC